MRLLDNVVCVWVDTTGRENTPGGNETHNVAEGRQGFRREVAVQNIIPTNNRV